MTPRPTHCAVAALALLATSVLVALYQTVALRAEVNPASTVASDYVFYPHGALLLTVSIVTLLLAGLALQAGLTGAAAPAPRSVHTLFGAWGLGLILVLSFPTDPPGHPLSLHGAIHRYAGATVFASLPAAGWILARHLHHDPRWQRHAGRLRRFSAAAATSAAILGIYQLPPLSPGPPDTNLLTDLRWQGLAERIALGAEIALLFALARALWQVTRTPTTMTSHPRTVTFAHHLGANQTTTPGPQTNSFPPTTEAMQLADFCARWASSGSGSTCWRGDHDG